METIDSFSQFCVYTMRHTKELDRVYDEQGGKGHFIEKKKWISAKVLLMEAQKSGLAMPIIFASAEITNGLIYAAIIEDIFITENRDEQTTTYMFSTLTKLSENRPLRELILKSTDQPLSDNFIRPYAICYTPDFLHNRFYK